MESASDGLLIEKRQGAKELYIANLDELDLLV
jgi:hypothetical protein